jgi:beta-barrel assembly-enhancing protease
MIHRLCFRKQCILLHRSFLKCIAWTLLLAQLSCEQAVRFKETTTNFVADLIPIPAVEAIDKQSWAQLKAGLETIDGAQIEATLRQLVDPLISAAEAKGAPRFQWDFYVIKSPELNAFALPGGTIALNSGLVEFSKSGLEVIGILAHEVAHVAARHGVKSMALNTGVSLATSLLLGSLFGDMGGISDWALKNVASLGLLKFSRDNEREADSLGAELLIAAGYPVSGLAGFFKELEKEKEGQQLHELAQKSLSWLSTHPMSAERSASLEKLTAQQTSNKLTEGQTANYALLRKLVLQ